MMRLNTVNTGVKYEMVSLKKGPLLCAPAFARDRGALGTDVARPRLLLDETAALHRTQPRGVFKAHVMPLVVACPFVLDQDLLHCEHRADLAHVLPRERVVEDLVRTT